VEYTINKLAQLAGVSTRTLRYYDKLGLLRPARISSSGYRIYGPREVDRLQQIMLYRELDLSLDDIDKILKSSGFDAARALHQHLSCLHQRRRELDLLIETVMNTIAEKEGKIVMSDKEKFEGFKNKLIQDNEAQYGGEARHRWGDHAINGSNAKIRGMSIADQERLNALTAELYSTLRQAFATGDPASGLGQEAARLHKEWLCFFWHEYNPDAHRSLAEMYVDDPRFTAHYDKAQPGTAVFLRDAIRIFTCTKK
jgi:DNA-binding transcriptional MerR regulator